MSSSQHNNTLSSQAVPDAADPSFDTVKRTLCVHISGSMANFAMAGPQAALWKPLSGKEGSMFAPTMGAAADPIACTNSLRSAQLVSATVHEQYSTFPCTLGVSISCVPPNEVTELGEKYAYTVLPMSKNATPHTFFSELGADADTMSWQKMYPKYNHGNLDSEGVMEVNNQPFVFVNMKHPIVGLLRHNAEMIGCNIDAQPVIDGEWYKITRQVLSTCCNTLRTRVLSKISTHDLNMFNVQLHRLDANAWDDLGNGALALQNFTPNPEHSAELTAKLRENHLRQFVSKENMYVARLELEYKVPATPQVASAA
jgi:hypothetical protein